LRRYGPQGLWRASNPDSIKTEETAESGTAEANDDEYDSEGEESGKGYIKRAPAQIGIVLQSEGAEGVDELALRRYELLKLRYYFAIADCDEVSTATVLYANLDGMEFEHSSVAMDLR
jgi:hypothetical protein